MINLLNENCLINIQKISFNSFKSYLIFKFKKKKVMEELIKMKHINFFKLKFQYKTRL